MVLLLNESYLFKNDTLGVRSTSEGIGLPAGSQVSFLVVQISPSLDTTIFHVLASGPNTGGLTHLEGGEVLTFSQPDGKTQHAEREILM